MTTPNADLNKAIKEMMTRVRAGRLPTSDRIVSETFGELGYDTLQLSRDAARAEFNDLLHSAFRHTLTVLERYEDKAYSGGIPAELLKMRANLVAEAERVANQHGFQAGAESLMSSLYLELRQAFLSVSQSRKTRGGRDFELQFEKALTLADFPFEKQQRRTRVDFMMPSDAAFERNRMVCAIASLKRTLRERWREVVGELVELRAANVFLVTADDNISDGHVQSICENGNLHLVVWDGIKESRFAHQPLVLGFTEFASRRLPDLQTVWRSAGLI